MWLMGGMGSKHVHFYDLNRSKYITGNKFAREEGGGGDGGGNSHIKGPFWSQGVQERMPFFLSLLSSCLGLHMKK